MLAPRRAALASGVVDLVDGAPDLIATGAVHDWLAEVDRLDARADGRARRTAWQPGSVPASRPWPPVPPCGLRSGRRTAVDSVRCPAYCWQSSSLVPLAAFEALVPLPQAAILVSTSVPRPGDLHAARHGAGGDRTGRPRAAAARSLPAPAAWRRARWAPDLPLVLDGVTLHLPPGRHVAIVGESGCGKSTLGALLLRFLPAESGEVLLAGQDVARLSSDDVRRVVGLVADDAHVFASSLRANLGAGPAGRRRRGAASGAMPTRSWVTGTTACRTGWTPGWARPAPWCPAVSGVASRWPARCSPTRPVPRPGRADAEGLDAATAEAVVGPARRGDQPERRAAHPPTEGLDLVDEVHELRDGRLAQLP